MFCHDLAPQLKAASIQPTWTLPWFHQHYPLSFTVTFDKFVKPPKKPPPKITPPRTEADQLKFQRKFADTFATLTRSAFYTSGSHPNPLAASVFADGSCSDQYHVSVGNPAGWSFTIQLPTVCGLVHFCFAVFKKFAQKCFCFAAAILRAFFFMPCQLACPARGPCLDFLEGPRC